MGDLQTAPLGLGVQESGDEEFADAAPIAMNVLLDGAGAIRRRPGLMAYADFPSAAISDHEISGIYTTLRGQHYAIDQEPGRRRIRRLQNGAALDLAAPANADLRGTRRPTFAETEALLAIAGGGDIQKLSLLVAGTPSARLGGSPPLASHIIAQSSSFLCNRVETPLQDVHFSDPGTGEATVPFETWSGTRSSGNFRANLNEDSVVAIARTMTEVWAFCQTSTELWVPDPTQAFARTTSLERGCLAPDSVVSVDEAKAWLDHHKQFVMAMGRSEKILSAPIQRSLDSVTDPENVFGYRFKGDQFDCMVWTSPTDGRTFVHQLGGGWSQWSGWDEGYTRFPVSAHHLRRDTKENLIGTTDGKVGILTTAATDDFGDIIKANCQSGYKSRGGDTRKTCHAVRLTFRRDTLDTTAAATAYLRYRNEDGAWRNPIPIVLDARQKVVTLRSLGTYRRRQWEVEFDKAEAITLVSAQEEFSIQND